MNYVDIVAPSAPFDESPQPGSSTNFRASTSSTPNLTPSKESLRISTINFSRIPGSIIKGGYIPNGYAGFNWENAHYMYEDHVSKNYQLRGFSNAYTNTRKCVAYNGKGDAMSIFLSNSLKKFGLHSFEAMSIYYEDFKLSLTGYRSNLIYDTKTIILTKKNPTLFEIDWEQIDRITFTPARLFNMGKPETFALTCLNFVL